MKTLKTVDYAAQAFLISASLLLFIVGLAYNIDEDYLFSGYFIVGGWQIISVTAHFFVPAAYKISLRKTYLVMLLCTIIAGALSFINGDFLILFLMILLFWSPALAVLYLVTCIKETQRLKTVEA